MGTASAAGRTAPVRLPELGFGAAQLGNLYRVTTDAEAAGAIETAWAEGIRCFDTAPHYGLGRSEERLGALLSAHPREDYLLSTKVGRLLRPGPGGGDDMANGFAVPNDRRRIWDMSADGVRRSLEESCERLGTDGIDIAYLHDPEEGPTEQAFAEALPALQELREAGVVRAVGVGSKDAAVLHRAVTGHDIDIIMLSGRYTLLDRRAEQDLLPACLEHDVRVVAVSVYNSGILAHPEPPDDATYEYTAAPVEMAHRARDIASLAREHGLVLPELAVRFPLRHPAIDCVVLGMRTAAQVRENARRLRARVPEQLWELIDGL